MAPSELRPDRRPSVNGRAAPLVQAMLADAAMLRLAVRPGPLGCHLVDAGAPGGLEAGRRLAEICLGGLGRVAIAPTGRHPAWPFEVTAHTCDPVLACLASQYAGWPLEAGTAVGDWSALGSGPARALAAIEPLFDEIGYRDAFDRAVLVLEAGGPPPDTVVAEIIDATGVCGEGLTLVHAPTACLAGSVQVAARVLEAAIQKARRLHFPLDRIIDGIGAAPLPPPASDPAEAMGRTNDAIIYGGRVHLFVTGGEEEAEQLAAGLPSVTSDQHGRLFANVFRDVEQDFYAVDTALFSPAEVAVTSMESGRTFRAGSIMSDLLDASFS
jgi:methenyltetrahydromethanopterin cyclohydrolase